MLAFHDGPSSPEHTAPPPTVPFTGVTGIAGIAGAARGDAPAPAAATEAEALGRALSRAAATLRRSDPAYGLAPLLLPDDVAAPSSATTCEPCVDAFLDAVGAYVRALRAAGTPPEQVVIAVKRQMHVALGAHTDPRRVNAWLAHAVTWGIEEYYRG